MSHVSEPELLRTTRCVLRMLPSALPDVNNVGVPRATPVTAARFRKSRLVTFFCSLMLSLSLFEFGLQMTAT